MKQPNIFDAFKILTNSDKLKSFWDDAIERWGEQRVQEVINVYGYNKKEEVNSYHDLFLIHFALNTDLWIGGYTC